MIFTKHRFEIWSGLQHPYRHSLNEFAYTNPAAPGSTTVQSAFNWIFAVLYPQTKASVANVAALPAGGNTLNDFRVVQDDGDGKAAGYRWELREGEVSASWHKIYDMDWGSDSILEAFQLRTQDLYVFRRGYDDLDGAGAAVSGLYAGQTVTGGLAANSNLTLRANAGDGTGARTGFVQVDDQLRPTLDNTFNLGTSALNFKDLHMKGIATIGTLTAQSGSISDSGGTISFGSNILTTTGNVTGAIVTGTTSIRALVGGQSITLTPGTIADTTGAITFGANNLSTTGTLAAGVTTLTHTAQTLILDPNVAGQGSIISSTGTITFGSSNLITTGTLNVGAITSTQLNGGNVRISGNTVSITNSNGNLILAANGAGIIDLQSAMTTLGQTVTGIMAITGQLNMDNLRLDGNVISSTDLNGNITFTPNGSGTLITSAKIIPSADNTLDLGSTTATFHNLYLKTGISNGTNTSSVASILAFRSGLFRDLAQTLPAQAGDALFFDAVNSVWLANHPDTEITHSELTGLTTGDAGHTQFAMLTGRAGGQVLQGDTASSGNLTLESTSHASKGLVLFKDTHAPNTNASFSGTWSGADIGSSSRYFRDLYTKGQLFGARLENLTSGTLPSPSAQNIGRMVYSTDNNKIYADTGTVFNAVSVSRYVSDTSWNGSDITKTVTVSASVSDARNCHWQLRDNTNNFEIMSVKLTTPNATSVVIDVNVALAAGSYRLIGLE